MLSCSTKFHAILLPVHREICIRATQTPSAPVVLTPEEDGTVSVCVEPEAEAMVLCLLDRPCEIRLTSEVRQHARMRWVLVAVGGPIRVSLSSRCLGADAESSIDGVFLATDNADQRISVQNSFEAPGGEGEITIKGVAQDRACVSVRGMIVIGSSGRGTDTYLTQDVLMLDPTAKVNAVPGLEIRTSDVRASHSATVSKVTDEEIFYFGARGIPEQEAREMYVSGFLGEIVEKITDAHARQLVHAAIGM